MTSKPSALCIAACAFLFSCQQMETSDNSTPTDSLVNTSVYPVQQMQLAAPVGMRLSFTGRTTTDSSVFYQVTSTYKGATYGFNLSVPRKESGIAYFSSKGKPSDDLLHFLQGLYGQRVDSASHMGEYIPASYSSMGALVATKADSTADTSKPQKPQRPDNLGTRNKLLFRNAAGDQAEIYLDIDEKEHFIGLTEKDSSYRAPLVRCLTQK